MDWRPTRGEINTKDGFNTVLVNYSEQFALGMHISRMDEMQSIKTIHITLPDEFAAHGARIVGDIVLDDEKTVAGTSTQDGQLLKVTLAEGMVEPGEISMHFEAVTGQTEVERVGFSVKLLGEDGTILIEEVIGGDGNGNIADLNDFSGIAIVSGSPVAIPAGVTTTAVPGENDVQLTWTASSDVRVKGYEILVGDSPSSTVLGRENTRYTYTNASPGAVLSCNILAIVNERLKSQLSQAVMVTVGEDTLPPEAPPVHVKRVDGDTVELSWKSRSNDDARYQILRGVSQDNLEQIAEVQAGVNMYADKIFDDYFYSIDVIDDQENRAAKPLAVYPFFSDVSLDAAVDDLGDGVAASFCDYDNDGNLDIYIGNERGVNSLYHNNGDGTFMFHSSGGEGIFTYYNHADGTLTNIVNTEGIARQGTHAVPFGDYDNDGDLDLYVANHEGLNQLYRNDGDGTFTEIAAAAGADHAGQARGAAWADYDNDGNLDIYIANGDWGGEYQPNVLYKNNGDGTFTDVAAPAGVADVNNGGGVAFGDYDNDADLDLYLVNLYASNVLYRNNSDGTFTDVTGFAGVRASRDGRAVVFADCDNDLDLDILIGNLDGANVLFRNDGDGTFTDISREAGIVVTDSTQGIAVSDYDNDGDLDIYIANTGHENILYSNNGDGTFSNSTLSAGVGDAGEGVGVAAGDYDSDGDMDIYLANSQFQPNLLYRNNGNDNNWLQIKTVGTVSNRTGIGARVKVIAGELAQIREVSGGSGFCSQNSLPVEFGLGTQAKADKVEIRWPSGIVQTLTDVAANQMLTVTEETGEGDITVRQDNTQLIESVTPLLFADVTEGTGLGGAMGSACAVVGDYDGDSDLDLYNGRLHRNNGDNTFSDVTAGAGMSVMADVISASFGDLDGDNALDLIATNGGQTRLYRNSGDGTFMDITAEAGETLREGGRALALDDYDGDGHLDIYIARIGANRLYRNNGNGTFTDVTQIAGIGDAGWGEAAVFSDYNGDNAPDIYVANWGTANTLYRNNGDGTFTDVSEIAGVGHSGSAKDALFCDYNGDGNSDLFVANGNAQPNVLYRNNGDGSFTDVTIDAGLGGKTWTEATVCGDYDGDGNPDLYLVLSSGWNLLYRNNGDGTFSKAGRSAGVDASAEGAAAAFFDVDGDADLDLYLANRGGPNMLYRNTMR